MPKKRKRYGIIRTVRYSTVYDGKTTTIKIATCPYCMNTNVAILSKQRKKYGHYNKCGHFDRSDYAPGYGHHAVFYEEYLRK